MKNRFSWVCLISLILLISCRFSQTPEEADSQLHSPSGVYTGDYESIRMRHLTLAGESNHLAYLPLPTKSYENRELFLMRYGDFTKTYPKREAILILGPIHGDEYQNIADRLTASLKETEELNRFITNGGVLYIAPFPNPDGYDRVERCNANSQEDPLANNEPQCISKGKDMNRDYPNSKAGTHQGLTQKETRAVTTKIEEELSQHSMKLILSLSYHCCVTEKKSGGYFNHNGALLIPWGHDETLSLPSAHLAVYQKFTDAIRPLLIPDQAASDASSWYKMGTPKQVVNYNATGGEVDYFYDRYKATSIVLEGMGKDEQARYDKHVEMWRHVLSNYENFRMDENPISQMPSEDSGIRVAILAGDANFNGAQFLVSTPSSDQLSLCVDGQCRSFQPILKKAARAFYLLENNSILDQVTLNKVLELKSYRDLKELASRKLKISR